MAEKVDDTQLAPEEEQEQPETPEQEKKEAPEEPEPSQEGTEEKPEGEEPKEEPAEEEEPKVSRRESLRVQALLKKYGEPSQPLTPQGKEPDFSNIDADPETQKVLQETAQNYGKELYQQGVSQAEYYKWETLLNVDEPQVRTKYPELDPSNEKFHPALHNAMMQRYAMFVGYNPGDPEKGVNRSVRNANVRYLDFVEAEMEFADEIASQKVADSSKNLAKQAAATALRPDGSSAKRLDLNRAPTEMSDEELDAIIERDIPTKKR